MANHSTAMGLFEPDAPTINVTLMIVTPQMAADWLKMNKVNRTIRDGDVAKLAGAITRGEWYVNGDTIRFDRNGNLADGQHRLLAIVKANQPVQTLVAFNVPVESKVTMDTGIKRTLADFLKFRGEKNASNLAAALRSLWAFEQNQLRPNRMYSPTNQQLLALLDERPEMRQAVSASMTAAQKHRSSCAIAAVAYYLFSKLDATYTNDFFRMLRTGVGFDSIDHPVRKLGDWLAQGNTGPKRVTYSQRYTLAMYIKAWNAFVTDRPLRSLRMRLSGDSPEEFPTPIDPSETP